MTSTKSKAKLRLIVKKRLSFSIESISKECDITTQKEQLNLINITRESSTTINVSKQQFILMIDSSAKKKNISLKQVDKREFFIQLYQHKHDSKVIKYSLNRNEKMNIKNIRLLKANRHHHKKLILNTMRMITHDINQKKL